MCLKLERAESINLLGLSIYSDNLFTYQRCDLCAFEIHEVLSAYSQHYNCEGYCIIKDDLLSMTETYCGIQS